MPRSRRGTVLARYLIIPPCCGECCLVPGEVVAARGGSWGGPVSSAAGTGRWDGLLDQHFTPVLTEMICAAVGLDLPVLEARRFLTRLSGLSSLRH